ncbi:hypothetical protein S14_4 [Shewanella sp. phage 1/4]|nr:hypothetical protein S14_4 [Shewanella sp. phage 1/4]AHK11116.1 hypothetical protein S14_4 [Shewanella sp. phage 1/4]
MTWRVLMNKFIKKVKYRWTHSPSWVKIVDITCWVILAVVMFYLI